MTTLVPPQPTLRRPFARGTLNVHPLCEAGGNFVDTADSYSAWVKGHVGGESETIIGKWMKARGVRHEMIIATKVGSLQGDTPEQKGLKATHIEQAAEASLRRLQVETIVRRARPGRVPVLRARPRLRHRQVQARRGGPRGHARRGGQEHVHERAHGFAVLDALARVAKRVDATTAEVALAWLMTKTLAPIAGATWPHHVRELTRAARVLLSEADVREVENA